MKIHSIKIKNFRGYSDETQIMFDDLTVFVGKNDIGKSTILEALDIFFNDGKGAIKIDKTDINVNSLKTDNLDIEISVIFSELPSKIVIDSTVQTTLKEEYLLNQEQLLEIKKVYKNACSSKVFIKAMHPTNEKCAELLLKKNSELKKIVKENAIVCSNQNVNSILRHNIWKHFSNELNLQITEIDVSKEEAKVIWSKLSQYLPIYSLFQSDRKNSDSDDEVQDPLKIAVKEILENPELKEKLSDVADAVRQKLQDVVDITLENLRDMDAKVADSLNPVIPTTDSLKWYDVFKGVSIIGDDNIPINKRGSGIKRLILINFFRGEVQRRQLKSNDTSVVYAIEEPETSQHTENQRLLIDSLKRLSEYNGVQVILTTHSATIIKELEFSNLRLVIANNGKKEIKEVRQKQLRYPSLNEVNYIAFDEITEEYHNELYSYIESEKLTDDYSNFCKKNGFKPRIYKRLLKDNTIKEDNVLLSTFIRHQIHHPENKSNAHYTIEDLKASIDMMRNFIQQKTQESSN